MPRERALPLLTLVLVLSAGCIGSPLGDTPPSPDGSPEDPTSTTPTPLPGSPVDFPQGPKDRPAHPVTLNESSVREYARTFEYRLAYNQLWYDDGTEVSLDCDVDSVTEQSYGYEVVVTCSGYSDTQGTATSTATRTVLHADWGSQTVRYRVSENATGRVRVQR